MDSDELIRLTRDGSVTTIWLNRASKRNAMSYSMWAGVEAAATEQELDPEVRDPVLRGAGEHFCAGELVTAEHALGTGLVDEVVDAADSVDRLATLTAVLEARSLLTQAATTPRFTWSRPDGE